MTTLPELWLPIVVSGALVWIVSAIVWMALPHHKSDYRGLPDEEAARQALGPQGLAPGLYNIPNIASRAALKEPENQRKLAEGPVAFMTVLPAPGIRPWPVRWWSPSCTSWWPEPPWPT